MPTLGYRPAASGGPDAAILEPTEAIAYVADAPVENGFLYAVVARLSKVSANVSVDLGVFSTSSSGNPETALGHMAPFTVSSTTEGEFTRALDAAVLVQKGEPLAFAAFADNAQLRIDMAGADFLPGADNLLLYWDSGTVLHETWTTDASSYEGQLAIWGLYEANVVPDAPINCTPGSTSASSPTVLTTTALAFGGEFHDDNQALPNGLSGDWLKRSRVQVYREDTGALVWDSGARSADSLAIATSSFTIDYGGPTLSNSLVYRWRATVADRFDGWSAVSSWRYFTLVAGRVDTSTATPVGKTNSRTPTPFVAKWVHAGALAMNAVQVRIRDGDSNALVMTSATLGLTVANNGTISVAFATAFPGLSLPWDEARLVWEMRGRDTANVFSGWSGQEFWTNDPPHVPALYAPAHNAVVVTYPLLSATVTDTDDSGSAITVTFRIMNASGTVLFSRAGTYNATTKRYQYQTTAADLSNGFATYLWDAYAFDGTVYSGGTTSAASAQNTADRQFTYAQGPTVVITSPLDMATITSNTPQIVWTATAQAARTIDIARDGVKIHTSVATSTSRSYTIPAVLSTGEQLHDGDDLALTLVVTDANGLKGQDGVNMHVDYPNPASLQPSVTLVKGRGDITPSVVKISWPPSSESIESFRYYRLARTISADMLVANPTLPRETVVFKRMEITQTSYYDYDATSGIEYTYGLSQYTTVGPDTLSSVRQYATTLVLFDATILHAVDDPESKRLVFDARKDRTIETITDFAVVSPWNQRKPVQFESDVFYHEIQTEWVLAAKTPQDANYDLYRLEAMVRDGAIICYRDGRGNRFYGRFSSPPVVNDPPGGRLRTVTATFRELAYDPSSKE